MTPVTVSTQELRLATTMTGGVSLSIWMGGVTREINLLLQASEWRRASEDPAQGNLSAKAFASLGRYKRLLDLLDTVVDVDVLSGTSAGGINAVLLGYARVNNRDLGGLRDIWLEVGAFENLLRNPTDAVVPSLFYGDERLFAALAKQIPDLAPTAIPPGPGQQVPPTTLLVTTTLLTGEASRFTDSFGTVVQDVNHRGLFTFDESQLADTTNVRALALAGRSSASYPAAFEPSFLPFGDLIEASPTVPERPDMAPFMDTTRAHWAADGGLLDNQPLDVILDRVFQRPAAGPVRRVLLYVVPTAGPAPDLVEAAPRDDSKSPYGLLDGLLKDLSAVRGQSIARDLRAINEHNDRIAGRRDRRRQVCELALLLCDDERLLTSCLFNDLKERTVVEQAQLLVRQMLKLLSTWPPQRGTTRAAEQISPTMMPRPQPTDSWSGTTKAAEQSSPTMMPRPQPTDSWSGTTRAAEQSLPTAWQEPLKVGNGAEAMCQSAIENRLRDGYTKRLTDSRDLRLAEGGRLQQHDSTARATDSGSQLPASASEYAALGPDLLQGAKSIVLAVLRLAYKVAAPEHERTTVSELVKQAHDAALIKRDTSARTVSVLITASMEAAATGSGPVTLTDAAGSLADAYMETRVAEPAAWMKLAEVLVNMPGLPTPQHPCERQDCDTLTTIMAYLRPNLGDDTEGVARRLFDLAAVERAMEPIDADLDQPVELVQVSADTRTALDLNRHTAKSKLTGLQFHNFGAFYKTSWRANDWMWGRLDGAGWLVHVLLDPRRLKIVTENVNGNKAQWLLEKLAELDASLADAKQIVDLKQELAFLDDPNKSAPPSLTRTALWLAQAWQSDVLDEELPNLADTILNSPANPERADWSPASSRTWAKQVEEGGGDLAPLLAKCPVPAETFSSDKSSRLMTTTVTKAAATATAAVGSVRQLPGPVRPAAAVLRTLTLAAYRVAKGLKGSPLWMIVAGGLLLLFGALAAWQSWTVAAISGGVAAAVGGYLIVLVTWQRSSRLLGALASFTAVGAVAALTVPRVRSGLFGTSPDDGGVVGRNIYWVGSEWWRPLMVILIAAVIIGFFTIITSKTARNAVAQQTPNGPLWTVGKLLILLWAMVVLTLLVVHGWLFGTEADHHSWFGRCVDFTVSGWWQALLVIFFPAVIIGFLSVAVAIIKYLMITESKIARYFFKWLTSGNLWQIILKRLAVCWAVAMLAILVYRLAVVRG